MTQQFTADLDLTPEQMDELGTQATSIFGRRGSGKTYAAGRLCECLFGNSSPFVVLDPVGNLWSLRLDASGKKDGLPIRVLGGSHGDVPLPSTSGAVVAEYVWQDTRELRSLVLDLSEFEDEENEMLRFAVDFGQRFYTLARRHQQVCTLVLEEAHFFIPEQPQSKMAQKCRNVYRRHVRVGRNFGQGIVISSQRPQAVDKETINQCEVLIVGQLVGKLERDRIRDWVKGANDEALGLLAGLPKLKAGNFLLFSPSWLEVFQPVRVSRRTTFDASATPELRKKKGLTDPKLGSLGASELEDLRSRLGKALEAVEQDDPRRLREKNQELTRVLARLESEPAVPDAVMEELERLRALCKGIAIYEARLEELFGRELERIRAARAELAGVVPQEPPALAKRSLPVFVQHSLERSRATVERTRATRERVVTRDVIDIERETHHSTRAGGPSAYEDALLEAVVLHGPADTKTIALAAGKSPSSSTFGIKLALLVKEGWLERSAGRYTATSRGKARVPQARLPEGSALFDHWTQKLDDYSALLLRTLRETGRRELEYSELAALSGKSQTSSSFGIKLAKLQRLGLVEREQKRVRLGPSLRRALGESS